LWHRVEMENHDAAKHSMLYDFNYLYDAMMAKES